MSNSHPEIAGAFQKFYVPGKTCMGILPCPWAFSFPHPRGLRIRHGFWVPLVGKLLMLAVCPLLKTRGGSEALSLPQPFLDKITPVMYPKAKILGRYLWKSLNIGLASAW